jgi:hypothetical protein
MKVLSHTTRAPTRCAASETACKSVTIMTGFVGVSKKTIRVFSWTAASTFDTSEVSTNENSML